MNKSNSTHLILAIAVIPMATQVVAGDLYRIDVLYERPIPSYPAEVVVDVLEGARCNHFKGTASVDFDGISISNNVSDDVVYIDNITTSGSTMVITFSVLGYDNHTTPAKFKSKTCFLIDVNGSSDSLSLTTSC